MQIFTVLIIVPAEAMETAIACTVSVLIEATIATVEATEAALRTFLPPKPPVPPNICFKMSSISPPSK